MFASKTHFKTESLEKKKKSCGLFYLLVRYSEVAGMLFEAPTLISFSVFLSILFLSFLSILFMSFSNSVFCTLHLYKGMCNIIIRTLQWLV